jgi:UDP-N-acetylmuramate--alanine ligase
MEKVKAAYLQFVQRVPFYGLAVLCIDNVNVRAMLPKMNKRYVTYGTSPDADWQARELRIEGMETPSRSGAASGASARAPPHAGPALRAERARRDRRRRRPRHPVAHRGPRARGVRRRAPRFEVRGEERDIVVVDDYGHHPEEVRATLRAAREGFPRRLVVAFQPHRFTRTRDLFDEFLTSFDDADVLVLTEIYPAGEDRIEGVSGEQLYQALKRRGHLDVRLVAARDQLAESLLEIVRPGDLVLTLGAGDVYKCADELPGLLRAGAPVPAVH